MHMFTTEQIMTIIIAVLGSSGIWSVITIILQNRMEKRITGQITQEANNEATLAILRQLIYDKCDKYVVRGCVTSTELKNLEELWKPYYDMHGNGIGKLMHEKVLALPVVTEDEKIERINEKFAANISTAGF